MTRPHPETNQHLLMSYSSLLLKLSTQFSCFFHAQTYTFHLILSRCCFESLTETVLVSSSPPPSTRAPRQTADDLYTVFSTKQKKREKAWALNQAAKMANVTPNKSPRDSSVSHLVTYRVTPSLPLLGYRLEASKNEEYHILKNQLCDPQQANADAVKQRWETQEKFCKVSSKVSNYRSFYYTNCHTTYLP